MTMVASVIRGWARTARQSVLRGLRASSGAASIELGFVIPVLVLLAVGMYDFGRLGLEKITMTSAARAGAQYGTQGVALAGDVDGMIGAARTDAGDAALDVAARQFCSCPGMGELPSCSASCPDGEFSLMYVEVTAQDQVNLLFDYPGIGSPKAVAATARMRVR